jgi:uncharacterized protein with ParB-like and HNH nuclease domain
MKINFVEIISYLEFVDIVIDEKEDEQKIFGAINSIGVQLTSAELLKNYLFKTSEQSLYKTK